MDSIAFQIFLDLEQSETSRDTELHWVQISLDNMNYHMRSYELWIVKVFITMTFITAVSQYVAQVDVNVYTDFSKPFAILHQPLSTCCRR